MDKSKYATSDTFVHYEAFPDPRKVLLATDQRIIYCTKHEMLGAWTVSVVLRLLKKDYTNFSCTSGGMDVPLDRDSYV